MNVNDFLRAVASVGSSWSLAAYAIAAVLTVLNITAKHKTKAPMNSIIWGVVVIICVLGLAPTLASAYLKHLSLLAVYRVRTLVLDPQHVPVSGAVLRTTASNETSETSQGIAEVAIPRAMMPSDGKITIFADLNSAFLHGHTEVQLANDPNPSATIELKVNGNAAVSGMVEDDAGRAVPNATASAVGGESSKTAPSGAFTVNTSAAVGQQVRLHVEKDGYRSVDQDHPAGTEPVTIVLVRIKRTK